MAQNSISTKCETCSSVGKSIFCELEKMDLQEVTQHKVTNKYKKGQNLFFQGNPAFGLYCINDGKIKVSKSNSNGDQAIIAIADKGDVVGYKSLFTEEYYSATATAMEDATVCFIDKKYIMQLIKDKPVVALQMIAHLSQDLGGMENRFMSLSQKSVRERLAELLLLFKQSYGIKEKNGWKLDIKLTREEMASMLGMANETLIRLLTDFKDEGLINQEGKTLYLCNEESLVQISKLEY